MDCAILKNTDTMVGADLHSGCYHAVVAPLKWGIFGAKTGKDDVTVRNLGNTTIVVGSDIGKWIPHIPTNIPGPNPLFFLLPLSSSSASNFGASSVLTSQGPVAVAALKIVAVNTNCADGLAGFGFVLTLTPNLAGFSLGDVLAGVLRIGFGAVVGKVLEKVANVIKNIRLPGFFNAALRKLKLGDAVQQGIAALTGDVLDKTLAKGTLEGLLGTGLNTVVKKGYDAGTKAISSFFKKTPYKDSPTLDDAVSQFADHVAHYLNTGEWSNYPTPPPTPNTQDTPNDQL